MQLINNENGFITLLAMVITITVVGGGILMSTAVVDKVSKDNCEDVVNSWRSGDVYADIASNKEGAIEKAQKCQQSMIKATQVAKANAALLGRASNISGNPADLVATEMVNTMMDYAEKASEEGYRPIEKNIKPSSDVYEVVKEKMTEKEAKKTVVPVDKKEDIKPTEEVCVIEILSNGSPNVKASCEDGKMGFWYSDKDGDIVKVKQRFRMSMPDYNAYQELEWQVIDYVPKGNSICGFEGSVNSEKPEALFGQKWYIDVDVQLIDKKGNISNVSSCRIN